jgi:hypothetical protein
MIEQSSIYQIELKTSFSAFLVVGPHHADRDERFSRENSPRRSPDQESGDTILICEILTLEHAIICSWENGRLFHSAP